MGLFGNMFDPQMRTGSRKAGAGQAGYRGGGDEVAGGMGHTPPMQTGPAGASWGGVQTGGNYGGFGPLAGQGIQGGQRGGGDEIAGGMGYAPPMQIGQASGPAPAGYNNPAGQMAMQAQVHRQNAGGGGQTRGGGDMIPGGTGYTPNGAAGNFFARAFGRR